MTRLSGDELRDGYVWNGFDYALQVWVVDGVVQRCGHPPAMARGGPCCPAFRLAGRRIDDDSRCAAPPLPRRTTAPGRAGPITAGPRTEA